MASVLVKNTRTHDIILNACGQMFTIPAGVHGPAGFAPGYATLDESFIDEAVGNNIVKHYFDAGLLIAESLLQAEAKAAEQLAQEQPEAAEDQQEAHEQPAAAPVRRTRKATQE